MKIGPLGRIYHTIAIARHYQYEPISFNRDLALVFLQEPIQFDEYVGKVCLPISSTPQPDGKKECYVSSMSKDFEHGKHPNSLFIVERL